MYQRSKILLAELSWINNSTLQVSFRPTISLRLLQFVRDLFSSARVSSLALVLFLLSHTMESSDGINGIATRITVSVSEFLANEFDYVIIGGGTAGLVCRSKINTWCQV